jgi:hypothetical protein
MAYPELRITTTGSARVVERADVQHGPHPSVQRLPLPPAAGEFFDFSMVCGARIFAVQSTNSMAHATILPS